MRDNLKIFLGLWVGGGGEVVREIYYELLYLVIIVPNEKSVHDL